MRVLAEKTITKTRQKGVVTVMFAMAVAVVAGVLGMAVDGGHAILNKSRLQNMMDSSAMAGARVYNQTQSVAAATQAARNVFQDNLAAPGNGELQDLVGTAQLTVEFSEAAFPFNPGNGPYVRVELPEAIEIDTIFSRVLSIDSIPVSASAMAGPSPPLDVEACNTAPLMICGDPERGREANWGYDMGGTFDLSLNSQGSDSANGVGNFRLTGSDGITNPGPHQLAAYDTSCIQAGDSLNTRPGRPTGPAFTGLNTRFGIYDSPFSQADDIEFPPDQVSTAGISHSSYKERLADGPHDFASGMRLRRELAIPVGNCAGVENEDRYIDVMDFMCVFLVDPAGALDDQEIVRVEVFSNCVSRGNPGSSRGTGPIVIQLYEDASRWDS